MIYVLSWLLHLRIDKIDKRTTISTDTFIYMYFVGCFSMNKGIGL